MVYVNMPFPHTFPGSPVPSSYKDLLFDYFSERLLCSCGLTDLERWYDTLEKDGGAGCLHESLKTIIGCYAACHLTTGTYPPSFGGLVLWAAACDPSAWNEWFAKVRWPSGTNSAYYTSDHVQCGSLRDNLIGKGGLFTELFKHKKDVHAGTLERVSLESARIVFKFKCDIDIGQLEQLAYHLNQVANGPAPAREGNVLRALRKLWEDPNRLFSISPSANNHQLVFQSL